LGRNPIVKSAASLSGPQRAGAKLRENDHKGAFAVSALEERAVIAPKASASWNMLASRGPKPSDTLIASAVLAALIAGWVMNFVSVKQLSSRLGDIIGHASPRQT
jgi:hypothetical protein